MTGIFDAHHHLWDTRVLDYGLFRQSAPALDRPFLLDEYEREARELGVTGSLWVEAASAGADGTRELEWATEHVDGSSIVEALVAWVTLEDATEEDFDRLAGRHMEIEALTGAIVAAGERHRIATPVNRTLLMLLRAVNDAVKK